MYGASDMDDEALEAAKQQIQSAINKAWNGEFVDSRSGIKFTVTADVKVEWFASEAEAKDSGMMNVVGLNWSAAGEDVDSFVQNRNLFASYDTGKFNLMSLSNGTAAHEFIHLLGKNNFAGGDLTSGDFLRSGREAKATSADYNHVFGKMIREHRLESSWGPNPRLGRAGLEKSQFQGPRNYTKTYYPRAAWAFQEE